MSVARSLCHRPLGWIGSLLIFASPVLAANSPSPSGHAPIPVRFELKAPGYVTLVIEDASGKRVRNLLSETPFHTGVNTAWWDGLDDLGRDTDAAAHAIYHIPGQFVTPGTYRVRGLVRPQIDLIYGMTPYHEGNPPWQTADKGSEWLSNHTPPSSIQFVPAGSAPKREGKATSSGGQILVGSFVSEGGSGLAWLDMSGRKLWGQGWIGGVWTGASHLTRDAGDAPVSGVYAYTGSAWENELRLYELRREPGKAPGDKRMGSGDDQPVLVPKWEFPNSKGGAWNQPGDVVALSGLAAYNGRIAASLPKLNALLFVDGKARRAIGTVPVQDPRGLAFDSKGRLLVLSGKQLLRYALPEDLSPYVQAGNHLGDPISRAGWTASATLHSEDAKAAIDGDSNSRWLSKTAMTPGMAFVLDMGTPQTFAALSMNNSGSNEFPRSFEVYASTDGKTWGTPLAEGKGSGTTSTVEFPRTTAQWVKIVQTGQDESFWSINELNVYSPVVAATPEPRPLPAPEVLVSKGLEDPQQLAVSPSGDVYVSDRGKSHQVKVFDATGRPLRSIGHPGSPQAGPYDPAHLNQPNGITLDDRGRLWVAEEDFQPKRVSVWDAKTGKLLNAFYGPQRYGGGGEMDPKDRNAFFYDGMKLHLDWKTGKSWPVEVFYRPGEGELRAPDAYGTDGPPQTPLYAGGRQYLTNAYSSNPTNGAGIAMLWLMDRGVARPVAAMGGANDWSIFAGLFSDKAVKKDAAVVTSPPFAGASLAALRKRLPADFHSGDRVAFLWSDGNGDARMQAEEVTFAKGESGGVTVMPDLSFVFARLGDRAMRYSPLGFTPKGAPRYDFGRGIALKSGVNGPASSGGDQALVTKDGWTLHTNAPKPFAPEGLGGSFKGQAKWSYPSLWPGLHASHISPLPDHPGELIGTTRLLGLPVTPRKSDAGEIWAVNGNKGNLYLFTTDGLFVATLFKDSRQASWTFPQAKSGMRVDGSSAQEESFWPFIMQSADGSVWLTVNGSLIRVEGLEEIRRLPAQSLTVTSTMLREARTYFVETEAQRQQTEKTGPLTVALRTAAPVVDGKLDDWAGADWVTLDTRMQQEGDWGRREFKTEAALAVSGDRLYAAFRTDDPNLLRNEPEALQNLFKTGGALDLMIGVDPKADVDRKAAVAGDARLLVTRVKEKTMAMLYRPVAPGSGTEPVVFASPLRTLKFDRVDDVSAEVNLAGGAEKTYEFSIPLATLGLKPEAGMTIRGDVGILRGNGFRTLQRVYWSNKATGLVSDLPSEAELTPQLWGRWVFGASPLER